MTPETEGSLLELERKVTNHYYWSHLLSWLWTELPGGLSRTN